MQILLRLDRDNLTGAIGLHTDAVERLRRLDGAAVVGDEDELRLVAQFGQQVAEASDVGLVQRGVDLVEHAEGGRGHLEQREDERRGRQ